MLRIFMENAGFAVLWGLLCHTPQHRAASFVQPDKQKDPENFAAYPAGFSGSFLLIAQSVLRAAFPVLSICLAIMLSSSCVMVAQFATR